MDQTHIHLLITHLPIFGSILGAIVLVNGLFAKSDATKIAAYNLLVFSSVGAVIAYLTGEGAEGSVEGLPGVLESRIHAHEEFALYALITLIILGVAAAVATYLTWRKPAYTKVTAGVVLVIALVSFGMVARTGYLGGQIRHTELNIGAPTTVGGEAGGQSGFEDGQGGDNDGDD